MAVGVHHLFLLHHSLTGLASPAKHTMPNKQALILFFFLFPLLLFVFLLLLHLVLLLLLVFLLQLLLLLLLMLLLLLLLNFSVGLLANPGVWLLWDQRLLTQEETNPEKKTFVCSLQNLFSFANTQQCDPNFCTAGSSKKQLLAMFVA